MSDLFSPLTLGRLALRNRVVMAPMTRSRCDSDGVPSDAMIDYYSQRAGAGMIVSEGIAPSAAGLGYCRTPGLYSQAQIEAWRRVTDSVHKKGGLIVAQLMHVGRVSHSANKPEGAATVAPSAIRARAQMYTDKAGMQPMDMPRALALDEIPALIEDYRTSARNAFEAGFDGVELHCTSGYLPAQFLSTGTNHRTDIYGGPVENRARFVLEVLRALNSVRGADCVGMRICPDNPFNDLADDDPQQTFNYLLSRASEFDLAYLHVIRQPQGRVDNLALGRQYFAGRLLGNESYSYEEAQAAVQTGDLDAVSFGRPFIANPDLVERYATGAALADFDPSTLYTPGPEGYSTYPAANIER